MQVFCQWLMVLQFAVSFLANVYWDFNGREKKQPGGYSGFIGTIVAIGITAIVAYGAGCFTVLLGR